MQVLGLFNGLKKNYQRLRLKRTNAKIKRKNLGISSYGKIIEQLIVHMIDKFIRKKTGVN